MCSPAQALEWTAEAQARFDTLKTRLTTAPVLRTHDPQRRFQVVTDASGLAVSVILTQPDDEGVQYPIAYESRKLTASERKYSPYALEMLAVVHAFKAFRHYLLGAPGAPGLRAGQVLPPFRASVREAGSPTDGLVQPRPGVRVDGGGAGEL